MKLILYPLLLAVALASTLATVSYSYGPHSIPGIWIAVANFPGAVIGIWAGEVTGKNVSTFYSATILANWLFYFILAKAYVRVRSQFTNRHTRE